MKFKTFYKLFYKHRFKKASASLKLYLCIILPIRFFLNIFFFQKKIDLDLLELTSPNLYKKKLNFLFEYFDSDKGDFFVDQYVQPIKKSYKKIPAHGYSKFYEKFFFDKKEKQCNILELGSFYGNALASLFFYFKYSTIYSGDIYPDLLRYKSKRINNFFIDSSSEDSIKKNLLNKEINFDIIIDDAGHFFKDQIITLFLLFRKLNTGGIFIVEELDFPDTRKDMNINNEKPTLKNILLSIIEKKEFDSKYISENDKKYLLENYAYIEIFKGNVNEIAFIKKK
jgi:hypothetical protein